MVRGWFERATLFLYGGLMNRLIAVVMALVLSACSYDPYHYYYYCSQKKELRFTDPTTKQPITDIRWVKKPTIYVHNNVLYVPNTKADNGYLEYPYIKEDERYRYYGGKVRSEEYMSRIEYQRERSLIVTIEKDTNIISNAYPMEDWDCNVVREPIEEEQWGIDP